MKERCIRKINPNKKGTRDNKRDISIKKKGLKLNIEKRTRIKRWRMYGMDIKLKFWDQLKTSEQSIKLADL